MEVKMNRNFSNSFNPVASINFSFHNTSFVTLKIYYILGEEITVLLTDLVKIGYHSVNFDATRLPSGVYFYRIIAGSFTDNKKMILMR